MLLACSFATAAPLAGGHTPATQANEYPYYVEFRVAVDGVYGHSYIALSPLRPFRPLRMFQILTSVGGRRPHNTGEAPGRVLVPNRFACFLEPDFSLGLRIFAVCVLPSPPILLGLTLDRWRIRVFDLDPMR